MASTYVNDLRLNEMATGDGSGTWGTTTNTNLELIGEAFSYGTEAIADASTHTITIVDGASDGARSIYVKCTGGGQACTVTLAPATVSKIWMLENATSYTLTFSQGSGANVAIPAGDVKIIATDGGAGSAVVYDLFVDLNIATKLTIKNPATSSSPATVLLQSGDTDVAAADVLGKIQFQAPDEAAGTDAILVAAAIEAVSEGDFSSSNNATKLLFKTGASEAATEKMSISSAGDLTIATGGDLITATAGTSNFRAGVNAGTDIEAGGNYNVVVGDAAGRSITTGDDNVAVGYTALYTNTTGYGHTATGRAALYLNTTGAANNAVGQSALYSNTTANHNTAMGYFSLYLTTTGGTNIAVGNYTLYDNTTGTGNVAVGYYALGDNTTATSNTALGTSALRLNTTGVHNVAVGTYACNANTTASHTVGVGFDALGAVTTGSSNTAIGNYAGDLITTGNANTCLGYAADVSAVGAVSQIVIGNSISGGEDSQVTIGKTSNVIQNEFDTDATWTRTSDRRKKRNIEDDTLGLEFINNLRTVTHQWKPSNEFPKEWDDYSENNNMNLDAVMHGMIAQEVKEALDKSGCDTFAGWNERPDGSQTVSREMFVIPLIKAVQELSAEVKELKEKLNDT
jgi:hypothetical protein